MRIDLNADVGESPDGGATRTEALLFEHVTSASIACGFHAGGPTQMRHTVELASRHGVAVGAHPSFPDREGFGRTEMRLPFDDVESLVLYQVGAIAAIAAAAGVRLQHVKPHGALYNMSARDDGLASAIARAVVAFDPSLVLIGLAGSVSIEAAERVGLRAAGEAFADRAYLADGTLAPRSQPGAVLSDPRTVVERAVRMVTEGLVATVGGEQITVRADSLCVHSDTPGAAELAAALRSGLAAAGITVMALGAR